MNLFSKNESDSLKGLVWVSSALAVAAGVAIAFTIANLRDDALQSATRDQSNLAAVLSEQVAESTRSIDSVLDDVARYLARGNPADEAAFRRIATSPDAHLELVRRREKTPQVDGMSIVGDDGAFLASSRAWPAAPVNVAEGELFKFAASHTDQGLHIGAPIENRLTNRPALAFGKRISAADGRFLGVAMVAMDLDYYQSVYRAISGADGESMKILREDGVVLLRYPGSPLEPHDRVPAGSPWFHAAAAGGGAYRHAGVGGARIVAVKPVEGYPMIVDVSEVQGDVLALWRARTAQIIAGAFFALICVGCLLRSTLRQFRRVLASEASLEKKGKALERLNDRFGIVLSNMPHGVVLYSKDRRVIIANNRYAEMYDMLPADVAPGTPLDEILAKRIAKGIFVDNSEFYLKKRHADIANVGRTEQVQSVERLLDGRVVIISRKPIPGGGWLAVHEDITARQKAEDRIRQLAHYDQLTGAANRAVLLERMKMHFSRSRRQGAKFAILLLDLDDFKGVNDSFGHPVGDGLLQAFVTRLQVAVRETDLVARVGGDEFAVLLADVSQSGEDCSAVAQRIQAAIREPFDIDGVRIDSFSSIGVAIAPDDGHDMETLLKNADVALYQAKTEGRNCIRYFDSKMDLEVRTMRALKNDLVDALAGGQLEVHYQPVVDVKTGRVCCMEALARWRHPERGMIPPGLFIGIAERSGLIDILGAFVLRTACLDAVQWPKGVKVSVNLSPAQFPSGRLVETVRQTLVVTGLEPERLVLEITESTLMENIESNLLALHALKDTGAQIALDDFGTGYSSLSYLQSFPLDIVKIDRSFIVAMQTRERTSEIVALIVAMSQRLEIATVAEGVETQEQLDLVLAAGCTLVQGFYFSGPRRIEQFDLSAAATDGFGLRAA